MFLHDGPEIIEDEDGFIGQCACGWETTLCETQRKAEREFDAEHLYAAIDLTPSWDSGPFRNMVICTFCGNEGHSKDTCSRRPLLRI